MRPDERVTRHAWLGFAATLAGAALVALAATTASADVYRWVDDRGVVHYSNALEEVPPGRQTTRILTGEQPAGGPPPDTGGGGAEVDEGRAAPGAADSAPAGEGDVPLTAAEESLARASLEREQRTAVARIAEIDRKLEVLAAARLRWADEANPAAGGVRALGAAAARSEEEKALEQEREELRKRLEDIRARSAALAGGGGESQVLTREMPAVTTGGERAPGVAPAPAGAVVPADHAAKHRTPAEESLARESLEREHRTAAARIAEIDRKLEALAAARLKWADEANPAVGGVRALGAADARSEEEETLEAERRELQKQLEDIRARLTRLPGK